MSHDIQWTHENVARFWDGMAGADPESYFSAQVAPSLADWMESNAPFSGQVVDVGCGRGDLLAELAGRGKDVLGVDSSVESLRVAGARLNGRTAVGSVTSIPIPAASAGSVLLIETIEHVLDQDLPAMFVEIRRVLRDNAPLVITTPNAEDLAASMITCPECGARFHRMQHVRSWTADSLAAVLRTYEFRDVKVVATRLAPGRGLRRAARRLKYRLTREAPHLLAVARK